MKKNVSIFSIRKLYIISLIMVFCMMFTIFNISSSFAEEPQPDTCNLYQLREQYEEANKKVLEQILEHGTTQDLFNINIVEVSEYLKHYVPDALTKDKQPIQIIEHVVIDGAHSTVYVYPDNSFEIRSIQFYNSKDKSVFDVKKVLETDSDISILGSDTNTYDITDFNVGDNIHVHVFATVFAPHPISSWKLNTYFYVDIWHLSITGRDTNNSWAIWPRDIISTSSQTLANNSSIIRTKGTYKFFLDILIGTVVRYEYLEMRADYTNPTRIRITETYTW